MAYVLAFSSIEIAGMFVGLQMVLVRCDQSESSPSASSVESGLSMFGIRSGFVSVSDM